MSWRQLNRQVQRVFNCEISVSERRWMLAWAHKQTVYERRKSKREPSPPLPPERVTGFYITHFNGVNIEQIAPERGVKNYKKPLNGQPISLQLVLPSACQVVLAVNTCCGAVLWQAGWRAGWRVAGSVHGASGPGGCGFDPGTAQHVCRRPRCPSMPGLSAGYEIWFSSRLHWIYY